MSIDITLIHTRSLSKVINPSNIIKLDSTNLTEYFIECGFDKPIGSNQKLFYSMDSECPKYTRTSPYGITLTYVSVSDLKKIPKTLLTGKKEKQARLAIDYLKSLDGFIILYYT